MRENIEHVDQKSIMQKNTLATYECKLPQQTSYSSLKFFS